MQATKLLGLGLEELGAGLRTPSVRFFPGEASNCAIFEKYKTVLRATMEKPHVTDLQLKKYVDLNYRSTGKIGNGSTAAAIRYELKTGNRVSGRLHSQKGQNMILRLERWLQNNPTASSGDRAAAENIIKDLRNALSGESK